MKFFALFLSISTLALQPVFAQAIHGGSDGFIKMNQERYQGYRADAALANAEDQQIGAYFEARSAGHDKIEVLWCTHSNYLCFNVAGVDLAFSVKVLQEKAKSPDAPAALGAILRARALQGAHITYLSSDTITQLQVGDFLRAKVPAVPLIAD